MLKLTPARESCLVSASKPQPIRNAIFAPLVCRKVRVCAQGEGDQDGDDVVQDALVGMIRLEIGKKKVEEFVEESSEQLRAKAEEAKEEMDKLAELTKMRSDLAFDSALADLNKEALEMEEELRKSREEMESSEKNFNEWEQDMNVSRSAGQFFQSLYQSDKKKPVGMTAEELKARTDKVKGAARKEIGSPFRVAVFSLLSVVLLGSTIIDLIQEPKAEMAEYTNDAFYAAIASMAAYIAYNEKRALGDDDA